MRMINKFAAFVLSLSFLLVLAGCGGEAVRPQPRQDDMQQEEPSQPQPAEDGESASSDIPAGGEDDAEKSEDAAAEDAPAAGSDILVVYFSRTGEQYRVGVIEKGNTAVVAEMIAESTGADIFEVLPAEDNYPTTYSELTDVAKRELNEGARPAYAGPAPDMSRYSTVFIGAPVWWGDWPMIMYTFFEGEALGGKTLVPFSTHEGSGLSGFDKKLAAAVPDSEVAEGLAIRGEDCQNKQDSVREKVSDWLEALGY